MIYHNDITKSIIKRPYTVVSVFHAYKVCSVGWAVYVEIVCTHMRGTYLFLIRLFILCRMKSEASDY